MVPRASDNREQSRGRLLLLDFDSLFDELNTRPFFFNLGGLGRFGFAQYEKPNQNNQNG